MASKQSKKTALLIDNPDGTQIPIEDIKVSDKPAFKERLGRELYRLSMQYNLLVGVEQEIDHMIEDGELSRRR
jgi:hypothetical protein